MLDKRRKSCYTIYNASEKGAKFHAVRFSS